MNAEPAGLPKQVAVGGVGVLLALAAVGAAAVAAGGCDGSSSGQARRPSTVTVAAAASLSGVLEKLAPLALEDAGVAMRINAGASGTLAQQIPQGAPADVFVSANARWMDVLADHDRIEGVTRMDLLGNRLVLIASPGLADPPTTLSRLATFDGRITIGDPAFVPAGQYAREALIASGVWEDLRGRLLTAVDARAALAYVANGAAPLGVVYATDAAGTDSVSVVGVVSDRLHAPIRYQAAVVRDAADPPAARRLLAFLSGAAARRMYARAGFEPVATSASKP